ncbi:MAG TPA: hypothetical protein VGW38_28900, partial [Chloroflexota bacterium]|nr:hypothetical protein [Chloroflexota bacterium]
PVVPLVYICAGQALVRFAAWNRRSVGVASVRDNRHLRALLAATAVLVGIVPFGVRYYGQYQRADYSQITRRIEELQRPGDAVLLTGPWQAWYFDYYYRRDLPHHVLPQTAPPAVTPAEAQQKLTELEATRRRLWLVQAGLAQADPSGIVEHWLQRNAWPAMRLAHQNAVLSLYALHPPEHTQSLRATEFGGVVRLASGWVDRDEVPAGEVARLSFSFKVLTATPVNYKASLRLVGADGQRITTDFDLLNYAADLPVPTSAWRPGETVTVQRGIWLPPSANPQPYSVRLVIYDPATLQPLRPDVAGGAEISASPAGEALLGGLYITQSRAAFQPDLPYAAVERQFGGGDDFDTFVLKGYRWHQANPSMGPLQFDLLWQLWGKSGTTHLSHLEIVDDAGRMWVEEARPLFGGAFATHDWREGEILGERRALDVTTLPSGRYRLRVRLHDVRGQLLPLAEPMGAPTRSALINAEAGTAVEISEFTLPHRRPLLERVRGALTRVQGLWR